MTMRELAKLANVSVSTVSKAFHDADDISRETRELVFETARKYGCFGKFYKGKFHKQIIAIICPELSGGFYTNYVEQMQQIIESHNGIVLISVDHFSKTAQSELLEYYASYLQVDGIIIFNLRGPLKKGYDIPIVSLFTAPDPTVDTVQVNWDVPMEEAIRMLKSLGHKNITFIGEKLTCTKAAVFRNAIGEPEPRIIESSLRFEKAGEDGVRQLLETQKDCTAIICAYDAIAFGAIKQLKRSGYRVPDDISVVGIDNVSAAAHAETSLTTIDSNPREMCMLAWDIIQKKQESKYYHSTQNITITGKLILRETVGPAKTK